MRSNKRKPIILILITIVILFGGYFFITHNPLHDVAVFPNSSEKETEESEESEVYSALLKDLWVKGEAKVLLIRRQLLSYSDPDYGLGGFSTEDRISHLKEFYPSVSEDTLRDYDSKQLQVATLNSSINLPFEFVLVDEVMPEKGLTAEHNDSYYDKYPNTDGMISFSKVGFNKDRTEAFVFTQIRCTLLCGRGDQVLLEKVHGLWKIKENFGGWRS